MAKLDETLTMLKELTDAKGIRVMKGNRVKSWKNT